MGSRGAGQHTCMLGNQTWVVGGRGGAQPASEGRDEKDVGGLAQDRGLRGPAQRSSPEAHETSWFYGDSRKGRGRDRQVRRGCRGLLLSPLSGAPLDGAWALPVSQSWHQV